MTSIGEILPKWVYEPNIHYIGNNKYNDEQIEDMLDNDNITSLFGVNEALEKRNKEIKEVWLYELSTVIIF